MFKSERESYSDGIFPPPHLQFELLVIRNSFHSVHKTEKKKSDTQKKAFYLANFTIWGRRFLSIFREKIDHKAILCNDADGCLSRHRICIKGFFPYSLYTSCKRILQPFCSVFIIDFWILLDSLAFFVLHFMFLHGECEFGRECFEMFCPHFEALEFDIFCCVSSIASLVKHIKYSTKNINNSQKRIGQFQSIKMNEF